MSTQAVEFARSEWGWVDPTEDVIENAETQLYVSKHSLRTGHLISHLGLLNEARISELVDAYDRDNDKGDKTKILDKLIQKGSAGENRLLASKKNRILSFIENVQYFESLDDSYVKIHPRMQEKPIFDNCKSLNAVLIEIQGVTPVLVFADLGSSFYECYGIAPIDKAKHAIFKAFDDELRLGVAANAEAVISAQTRSSDGGNLEDGTRAVLVHTKLMDESRTRQLAVLHQKAISQDSTDIHITPDPITNNVLVEMRTFGRLVQVKELSPSKADYHAMKDFLLTSSRAVKNHSALKEPGDGEYGYLFDGKRINIRCSFIPLGTDESFSHNDVSIRLRLLSSETGAINLKDFNVADEVIEHMRRAMFGNNGLVLMVGATGTGKSTTQLGMVELHRYIYGDQKSRLALEDPVERQSPGITQFQFRRHANETDKEALERYLRAFVRHDPDLMMLGEIRDGDTARFAANAAVTGHKTLGTLHGSNTIEAIERILNMIENNDQKHMVVNAISHLFAQRLMPILCPHCKIVEDITEQQRSYFSYLSDKLGKEFSAPEKVASENPKGCENCNHLGLTGRRPVNEVLEFTSKVKQLALSDTPNKYELLKAERSITLEETIYEAVVKCETPISTLLEV